MPTRLKIFLAFAVLLVTVAVYFAKPVDARYARWFRWGDRDPFYALAQSPRAMRILITLLARWFIVVLWYSIPSQ